MSIFHIFLGVLVALMWAGNFIAAKIGLQHFEPLIITALRFMVVSALLVPFVKYPKGRIKDIFWLALTLGVGHFVPLFSAIGMGLDIGSTVIAGQLSVPFSCLLGVILMGETIGKWRALGLLVSFSGIFLIAGTPAVTENFGAFMMVVGASLSWGVSNIIMKRLEGVPIMTILGYMALFAFPMLLVCSVVVEHDIWTQIITIDLKSVLSITYTVLISTLAAYGSWYYLLSRHPISTVAPFVLLIPVFAMTFGILVFGETISAQKLAGTLLTLAGVAIIIIRRPKTALQET